MICLKKSFKYFLNKIFFKSHFEFKKITILLKNITFFLAVKLILNDDVLKKKIGFEMIIIFENGVLFFILRSHF